MAMCETIVEKVFVEIIVAHIVFDTQFFVRTIVDVPTIVLISLIVLQLFLVVIGIFFDTLNVSQVDLD